MCSSSSIPRLRPARPPLETAKQRLRCAHRDQKQQDCIVENTVFVTDKAELEKGLNGIQLALKAFRLFGDEEAGKISFKNLKRVAKELGERMLNEMIEEVQKKSDLEIEKCREYDDSQSKLIAEERSGLRV